MKINIKADVLIYCTSETLAPAREAMAQANVYASEGTIETYASARAENDSILLN